LRWRLASAILLKKRTAFENHQYKINKTNDMTTKLLPENLSAAALRREKIAKPAIFVGTGTCGLGAGARATVAAIKAFMAKFDFDADLVEVGCIGLCSAEPIVEIQMPGRTRVAFQGVTEDDAHGLLVAVLAGTIPDKLALFQHRGEGLQPWDDVQFIDEHPFFAPQTRWVLANCGIIDPASIDEYIAHGGYEALAKVLKSMSADEVCDTVERSGLRGRGGGGFPAGKKWKFARGRAGDQKYLICNADEGDPGAFMDRAVIEGDPHRLLEGMGIAAFGIGATKAYIYIRAEYPLAIERLKVAIAQAKERGFLGKRIMGTDVDLEIIIKMGAGAFVCGEETALIHSIEGKRGMPRPRPPFPAVSGLFGKPTIINNVETLANVPAILRNGPEWFSKIGTAKSRGTKVFALAGAITNTGLIEVPMGMPLREIIFDIGGGVPGGKRFKAVQTGGPSGGCIPESGLDMPCDYESLAKLGSIMGSGGMIVMDETSSMVDVAKFFMEFCMDESCGKCVPCRVGTAQMHELLRQISAGEATARELALLEDLCDVVKATSLCGLGQSAPNPVLSTLHYFREEYEAKIAAGEAAAAGHAASTGGAA
jgi:NADH-quinone oxidoreductase subunit F/NADP-reducing hydrogenase subunit HndC